MGVNYNLMSHMTKIDLFFIDLQRNNSYKPQIHFIFMIHAVTTLCIHAAAVLIVKITKDVVSVYVHVNIQQPKIE